MNLYFDLVVSFGKETMNGGKFMRPAMGHCKDNTS